MKNPRNAFHYISYLQYPLMVAGLIYFCKPTFLGMDSFWTDVNKGLVFFGLGISFSTLQDTTKTQNKLSLRVFENAKYSRIFLWVLAGQVIFFSSIGMFLMFQSTYTPAQELSFGFISIGIGMVGMLKAAGEMAVNHRKT